jgi:uracil-DNA glycosylase
MFGYSNEKRPAMTRFNFQNVDASWHDCLTNALKTVAPSYLEKLYTTTNWLPGKDNIFNAFSIPVNKVNYILFGESPYPRSHSANGYAFWDAAVTTIWSNTGLSKSVNRATSLRNIIKMLLVADKKLAATKTSQPDIANLDKSDLIKTNNDLFNNLLKNGFLLLNATLVLQPSHVRKDAKEWRPFLEAVLTFLTAQRPSVEFILLGNIANEIDPLIRQSGLKKIYAEHPYNISFINNTTILDFFRPFRLLIQQSEIRLFQPPQ